MYAYRSASSVPLASASWSRNRSASRRTVSSASACSNDPCRAARARPSAPSSRALSARVLPCDSRARSRSDSRRPRLDSSIAQRSVASRSRPSAACGNQRGWWAVV